MVPILNICDRRSPNGIIPTDGWKLRLVLTPGKEYIVCADLGHFQLALLKQALYWIRRRVWSWRWQKLVSLWAKVRESSFRCSSHMLLPHYLYHCHGYIFSVLLRRHAAQNKPVPPNPWSLIVVWLLVCVHSHAIFQHPRPCCRNSLYLILVWDS